MDYAALGGDRHSSHHIQPQPAPPSSHLVPQDLQYQEFHGVWLAWWLFLLCAGLGLTLWDDVSKWFKSTLSSPIQTAFRGRVWYKQREDLQVLAEKWPPTQELLSQDILYRHNKQKQRPLSAEANSAGAKSKSPSILYYFYVFLDQTLCDLKQGKTTHYARSVGISTGKKTTLFLTSANSYNYCLPLSSSANTSATCAITAWPALKQGKLTITDCLNTPNPLSICPPQPMNTILI